MPDAQDYYQLLRVSRDATQAEIKRAFRRLARQYHPDLNPGNPDAEAEFKKICEAYEVLGDAALRRRYDQKARGQSHAAPTPTSTRSGNPYTLYKQGMQKIGSRDYQGALHDFTQVIRLNPRFQKAYLKRCYVRYALGDDRGVLEDCQRVLQLNPQSSQAYYYQGLARYRLGYTQSAIEAYTQAIALDSQYARAYYQRGLAHQDLQEFGQATEDVRQAATLFQNQQDWHNNQLAQTALQRLNQQSALKLGMIFPTKGFAIAKTVQATLWETAQAACQFLINPAGGLLPAYARLDSQQAGWVGLLLGLLALSSFATATNLSWRNQLPISGFQIFLGGSVLFVSLAIGSTIARLVLRRQGSWSNDVFVAGAALLPMGLLGLASVIAARFSLELAVVLGIFTASYSVLTLYSGLTQVNNFSEQSAAFVTPMLLVFSGGWAYFTWMVLI